jgi:hypothetical protein
MSTLNIINKKIFPMLVALFIFASLSTGFVGQASAQELGQDQVTFSQIYSGVRVLRGPQDSTSMGFKLPAHWSSPTGGQLNLSFNFVAFGTNYGVDAAGPHFKAIVQVYLNNIDLGSTIVDKEGLQTISLPAPLKAWTAVPQSGINDITIQLTTNDQCGGASIMTIDSSSVLTITHDTAIPATDLRLLPWPLYQNTFYPDSAVLVLPDKPSSSDLKTALTVAAGFGRSTDGKLKLSTITASALTDTILQASHLIFVGKPDAFPQLSKATWPAKFSAKGFEISGMKPDDGVLQMVVSPWNQTKVILWVSGSSDVGIVKAGKALGSGKIRTGVQSSLAVVTETTSNVSTDTTIIDTNLSKLGYSEELRQGSGIHTIDYFLTIPYSQRANEDGFINLIYTNSALLDFTRSGYSVSVNDQFVGSGRFTERSTVMNNTTITIPSAVVLPGINRITITETLRFSDICARPLDSDLWAVFRPESTIHIPLGTVAKDIRSLNLDTYPEVFSPTLGSLAFIVAPSDPISWGIALDVAYDLGKKTEGTLIEPELAYADNLPEELLKARDLFIVGQPTKLPIMAKLNSVMPAPFLAGSDVAVEPHNELSFFIAPETSVGYLEMFTSPWNSERIILTLLGNGKEGLQSTQAALLTPALSNKLTGNLAVVYGNNIYSSTVGQAASQPVTIVVPATPTDVVSKATSSGVSQSTLILIGIIAVVVFIAAAIIIFLQRKRTIR